MATPQLENGHTRIANEILEHLMKRHLSSNEWQVVLCVIRKTYGFSKKVDYIANFQIGQATGLGKTVVSRILRHLNDSHMITRKGKVVGFQKDWEQWGKLAERLTIGLKLATELTPDKLAVRSTQLAEQSTKVSSPEDTQKKKETIQKKLYKRKYGEFTNVLLTEAEHKKLIERFGYGGLAEKIESLSIGIESKGYKYKSHYAAILSWDKRDNKGGQSGTHRQSSRQLRNRNEYTPDGS